MIGWRCRQEQGLVDEIEKSTDQYYSTRGKTTVQHSSVDTSVNLLKGLIDLTGEVAITSSLH